ncbi:hypothetical protein SAM19_01085 [Brevibacillus laterosporus]|nr:hypothetical protein [Brevibacillus laterosporus]
MPRNKTIKQFLIENKTNIDWGEFHRFCLEGNVIDHVFYDYLEPIVEFFRGNHGQLASYISYVDDSINDFLEAFIKKLQACYSQYGWPFKYMDTFGSYFEELHQTLPYAEAHCCV